MFVFIDDEKAADAAWIKNTLVHEVQHQADQHDIGMPWSSMELISSKPGAIFLNRNWNRYQTEFRSFWVQPPTAPPATQSPSSGRSFISTAIDPNDFGSPTEPAKNDRRAEISGTPPKGCPSTQQVTNFQNQRQERIFGYLSQEHYGFEQPYVCDPDFKKLVDAFAFPVGGNLVNSVRIQALSDALEKCDHKMDLFSDPVLRLIDVAHRLDPIDRQFVNDDTMSKPLWQQVHRHLADDVFVLIAELIKTGKLRSPETPGDFPERRRETVPS
jgi:hypothetical protein